MTVCEAEVTCGAVNENALTEARGRTLDRESVGVS